MTDIMSFHVQREWILTFNFEDSVLSNLDVNIHSLCTWKDIISVIEKRKLYNQIEINNLKNFLSNPDDWRKNNA